MGTEKEINEISNLITDMTLKGATQEELTRAINHSMVVIDCKRSEQSNQIEELKRLYL